MAWIEAPSYPRSAMTERRASTICCRRCCVFEGRATRAPAAREGRVGRPTKYALTPPAPREHILGLVVQPRLEGARDDPRPPGARRAAPPATALYAFSADPITYGHVDVVERVSRDLRPGRRRDRPQPDEEVPVLARGAPRAWRGRRLAHLPGVDGAPLPRHGRRLRHRAGRPGDREGRPNAADFDYEQVHHLVGLSQRAGIDTHVLFADPRAGPRQLERGEGDPARARVRPRARAAHGEGGAGGGRSSGQLLVGVTGVAGAGKSTLCATARRWRAAARGSPSTTWTSTGSRTRCSRARTRRCARGPAQALVERFGARDRGRGRRRPPAARGARLRRPGIAPRPEPTS